MAETQTIIDQSTVAEIIDGNTFEGFTEWRVPTDGQQLVYDQPAPLEATHIKHRAAKRLAELGLLDEDRTGTYFGALRWPESSTGTRAALETLIVGLIAFNASKDEELGPIGKEAFDFLCSVFTEQVAVEGIRNRLQSCRRSEIEAYQRRNSDVLMIPSRGSFDDRAIRVYLNRGIDRARRMQIEEGKL